MEINHVRKKVEIAEENGDDIVEQKVSSFIKI
jgi:hypothetical protein